MPASISELETRVTALEVARFQSKGEVDKDGQVHMDDSVRRARQHVESLGIYSARWKWTPPDYYDWSLDRRAECLGANSTQLLCKSLLLENRKVTDNPETADIRTNPQFLLVVLQYESTLDVQRLTTSMRRLRPVEERLEESSFDFRIASTEDNDRLTGYTHNSVTPFGLLAQDQVPIALSAAVAPLRFFWMGGGHVQLKVGVSVSDFLKLPNTQVLDLSVPRN